MNQSNYDTDNIIFTDSDGKEMLLNVYMNKQMLETTEIMNTSNLNCSTDSLVETLNNVDDSNLMLTSPSSDSDITKLKQLVHNTPTRSTGNLNNESEMMKSVNKRLQQLKSTPPGIFIHKLEKVDKLENALIDFKTETNQTLKSILKCIYDITANNKTKNASNVGGSTAENTSVLLDTSTSQSSVIRNASVSPDTSTSASQTSVTENSSTSVLPDVSPVNSTTSSTSTPSSSVVSTNTLTSSANTSADINTKITVPSIPKAVVDTNTLNADGNISKHFDYFEGDVFEIENSKFKAFGRPIHSKQEAMKFIAELITSEHMTEYEHFYSAYALENNVYDTHEDPGSKNIKNILKSNKITNFVVLVVRFFGGKHIYGKRWSSVSDATSNLLSKLGMITTELVKPNLDMSNHQSNFDSQNHSSVVSSLVRGNIENLDSEAGIQENASFDVEVHKTTDPSKLKYTPEVVLLTDSVGKHIEKKKFFGKKNVFQKTCPTISYVNKLIAPWHRNDQSNVAIIHSGINDIWENKSNDCITSEIVSSLVSVKEKIPNARIGYSSMVLSPNAPYQLKTKVNVVNNAVGSFCKDNNFVFIDNDNISNNALFTDDRHVNIEGTKKLVQNMSQCFRSRPQKNSISPTSGVNVTQPSEQILGSYSNPPHKYAQHSPNQTDSSYPVANPDAKRYSGPAAGEKTNHRDELKHLHVSVPNQLWRRQ